MVSRRADRAAKKEREWRFRVKTERNLVAVNVALRFLELELLLKCMIFLSSILRNIGRAVLRTRKRKIFINRQRDGQREWERRERERERERNKREKKRRVMLYLFAR